MDDNEQIIKKFHPDPLYFLIFYFLGIIFLIFSFFFFWYISLLGILIIFLGEIARRAETFYISEKGVTREYRLLSTSKEYAEYEKIQDMKVDQSFFENIFGIGDIHINTAGSSNIEINFRGIKSPYEIEKIIREKM